MKERTGWFVVVLTMLAFVGLFSLTACSPQPYLSGKPPMTSQNIIYFKDNRTNTCFAMFEQDTRSLTYVPCTEEVYKVANQRAQ